MGCGGIVAGMSAAKTVTLNTGARMPAVGLGVWQVTGPGEAERAVRGAIELGYRGVDTAHAYGNEAGVGKALKACGVPRNQLFVTTKVWNDDIRANRVEAAAGESLKDLGLDYVDLLLLHWPIKGQLAAAWKGMEAVAKAGRARAIGVSNYLAPHFAEFLDGVSVVPAVNQIEHHPYCQSRPLAEFCRGKGIVLEAWSPLMSGRGLWQDPELNRIARAKGKSVAQVVLRWQVELGVVTIPKAVNPAHQRENLDVFGFELSPDDHAAIAALDRGHRVGPDPLNFGF